MHRRQYPGSRLQCITAIISTKSDSIEKSTPYGKTWTRHLRTFHERTPARRRSSNLTKRRLNSRDKPKLKTDLTTGVETRGVLKIIESLGMKLIPHRATARLTRASASSLEIV